MEKKLFQQAEWWSLLVAALAGAAYLPYRAPSVPALDGASVAGPATQTTDPNKDAQPSDALTLVGQFPEFLSTIKNGLNRSKRCYNAAYRSELSTRLLMHSCDAQRLLSPDGVLPAPHECQPHTGDFPSWGDQAGRCGSGTRLLQHR
jgi:hypothetical protein